MTNNAFVDRHIGPNSEEIKKMLATIGAESIDQLLEETIPHAIRLKNPLRLDAGISEFEFSKSLQKLSEKNKLFQSYIGLGYHAAITPAVIQRNILENPGWYTAYTPYQAEISQGRLEALLNFQTMVLDLTGMKIANASLLDEATAGAEAMLMFWNSRSRDDVKQNKNKFFISEYAFPQTIEVVRGRAKNLVI